jgi:thioredoxin reductase (NADPH)
VVVEKVAENDKIDVITNATPAAFKGDGHLESVVLKDTKSGETRELMPAGVFVFIGLSPNTGIVKDLVEIDERGFIKTNATLTTSVPGVFAAGDCRAGSTKQAASAAGEGAAVALAIRAYLEPLTSGMPKHGEIMEEAVA